MRSFAERFPLVLIAGGVVLYAIGPNLIAASNLDGPGFLIVRLIVGLPLMASIVWISQIRSAASRPPTGRRLRVSWFWAVLAGLSFAAHQLCFMTAVKLTSVADAVLLDTLSPLVVMLLALPMFGEKPSRRFLLWSMVAVSGAVIVAVSGASGPDGNPLGVLLAALSVGFFALFFVLSKAARETSDVWPFLLIVSVIGLLSIATYFLLTGHPLPEPARIDVLLAIALAAGPGTLGHFLMTWPLALLPANVPPVLRLLTPFLAGLIAWAALGQDLNLQHIAGGALTAVGVLGALRFVQRPQYGLGAEPAS